MTAHVRTCYGWALFCAALTGKADWLGGVALLGLAIVAIVALVDRANR